MFQKQKFNLVLIPSVIITFESEFVDNNWHASILSIANNQALWRDNFAKNKFELVRGQTIYNDKVIDVQGVRIDTKSLNDVNIYYISERIAKYNKTIAFYEHGTFQAVYDFRK